MVLVVGWSEKRKEIRSHRNLKCLEMVVVDWRGVES